MFGAVLAPSAALRLLQTLSGKLASTDLAIAGGMPKPKRRCGKLLDAQVDQ